MQCATHSREELAHRARPPKAFFLLGISLAFVFDGRVIHTKGGLDIHFAMLGMSWGIMQRHEGVSWIPRYYE